VRSSGVAYRVSVPSNVCLDSERSIARLAAPMPEYTQMATASAVETEPTIRGLPDLPHRAALASTSAKRSALLDIIHILAPTSASRSALHRGEARRGCARGARVMRRYDTARTSEAYTLTAAPVTARRWAPKGRFYGRLRPGIESVPRRWIGKVVPSLPRASSELQGLGITIYPPTTSLGRRLSRYLPGQQATSARGVDARIFEPREVFGRAT